MIGYKAFDENLQCNGFQFEVGKTYETGRAKEDLRLCSDTVFHFCRELHKIENVSNYQISKSRVCEVIAEGDVVTDGDKFGTNKLTILREIPSDELIEYIDWNSGNKNIGSYNSGNENSGNRNTGNRNSGNRNSGNCNTGDWNSGDCNTGDWNSGDWNTGYFNTDEPFVRMFNKDTKLKKDEVHIPQFCFFDLTVWVSGDNATEEEKKTYKKEISACGGFLKKLDYKEAWKLAWNKANKQEHLKMLELPNWDNEVFKEISGIDAEAEIAKE